MRSKLSVLFVFICLIEAAGAQERKTMRGPIHGRVTDASGRPVPGVRVVLEPIGDTAGGRQVKTTSSKGEYRFDQLLEGNYRLTFRGLSERPIVKDVALHGRVIFYDGAGGDVQAATRGDVQAANGPRREVYLPNANVEVRGDAVNVQNDPVGRVRPTPTKARPTPTPLITTVPPDDDAPPPVKTPTPKPAATLTPAPSATSSPRINATRTPHDTQTSNTQSTNTQSTNTGAQLFPAASPGGSEATNTAGTGEENPAPEQLSDVDRLLQRMNWGSIAFNVHDAMSFEEMRSIELVLSPSKSIEEVAGIPQEPGRIETARIQFSNVMEASLTGAGFEVTKVTPERQPISNVSETVWKWDVRALKPGRQRLNLTMNAVFSVDGSEQVRTIRTFKKEVVIEVSWRRRVMDFGANNWQWLWAALGIPAATWFWSRRRKQVKQDGEGEGEVVRRKRRLSMPRRVKHKD